MMQKIRTKPDEIDPYELTRSKLIVSVCYGMIHTSILSMMWTVQDQMFEPALKMERPE